MCPKQKKKKKEGTLMNKRRKGTFCKLILLFVTLKVFKSWGKRKREGCGQGGGRKANRE